MQALLDGVTADVAKLEGLEQSAVELRKTILAGLHYADLQYPEQKEAIAVLRQRAYGAKNYNFKKTLKVK